MFHIILLNTRLIRQTRLKIYTFPTTLHQRDHLQQLDGYSIADLPIQLDRKREET